MKFYCAAPAKAANRHKWFAQVATGIRRLFRHRDAQVLDGAGADARRIALPLAVYLYDLGGDQFANRIGAVYQTEQFKGGFVGNSEAPDLLRIERCFFQQMLDRHRRPLPAPPQNIFPSSRLKVTGVSNGAAFIPKRGDWRHATSRAASTAAQSGILRLVLLELAKPHLKRAQFLFRLCGIEELRRLVYLGPLSDDVFP